MRGVLWADGANRCSRQLWRRSRREGKALTMTRPPSALPAQRVLREHPLGHPLLLPGSPQTLRLLRERERRPPPSAPNAPSATQCTQSAPSAPPRAPSPSDSELSTLPTTLAALREASKPSSPVASDASIDRDMLSPRDDISPVASGVIVEFACGLIWNQSAENFFFVKDKWGLEIKYNESATFPICNPALFCLVGQIGECA